MGLGIYCFRYAVYAGSTAFNFANESPFADTINNNSDFAQGNDYLIEEKNVHNLPLSK